MRILLTNDDGVYAPGIATLRKSLMRLGEVNLIAPATEQSGVGHSITFLEPLVCKQIFNDDESLFGVAVEGSPADSVKLGISELIDGPVDVVVSGINSGLNAGINVLYSGTVAAAIEGAFFRVTSFAISLEWDLHPDFASAAGIAIPLIEQILQQKGGQSELFNINIPTQAVVGWKRGQKPEIHVVPMGVERYGENFIRRQDPKGRDYYWATGDPAPNRTDHETDLTVLADGNVSVTPLMFDLTERSVLKAMAQWELAL